MNIENVLNNQEKSSDTLEPSGELVSNSSSIIEPKKKKSIVLYNSKVKKSEKLLDDPYQFTNYLNNSSENEFYNNIFDYYNKWNKLHDEDFDEVNVTERLAEIFRLYLKIENIDTLEVIKIKPRTALNKSTSLRIFLRTLEDKYEIFLFDPLHLVLPSKVQRENKTLNNNKGNSKCISKVFKKLDNDK